MLRGVVRLIHQLDRGVAGQAERAVGEIVDETRLDGPEIGRHGLQLLRRLARAGAAVELDRPLGIEVIGVLGGAQQVAADLDRAPRRAGQNAGAVDRQAALDVERGAGLNAQVAFIEQRSGLDGDRSTADRETQTRRDGERAGRSPMRFTPLSWERSGSTTVPPLVIWSEEKA